MGIFSGIFMLMGRLFYNDFCGKICHYCLPPTHSFEICTEKMFTFHFLLRLYSKSAEGL